MKKVLLSFLFAFIGLTSGWATPTLAVSSVPVTCFGSCDGQAIVIPTGIGPFSYVWSPTGGTVNIPTGLCAGNYTVTVTDNGDMSTATASVIITSPTILTVVTSSSTSICSGTCVAISEIVSGGTFPYTFNWSPASSLSSSIVATPMACPAVTTVYTLVVTDMNGCVAAPVTTTITVNPPMISGIASTNSSGCVSCDGTASVAPIFGVGPYVYLWNDPLGQTTATATALCAGTYAATITDASGCTIIDSTTVFANNDVAVNFTMVPDSTNPYNFFCFNSSIGTGNTYAWDFGDATVSSATSPTHLYSAIGTYNVCLTASSFLCGADTLCQAVNVTGVPASCLALFNIADDTLNPDPNAHYVYNLSYGATLSYLWDFGDGTTSTSMTPSHVYAGTGPYLLCLSVDNGVGCTDMYCDSLISADSLNRSSGTMQLVVYDLPTFYSTTGISNQANLNSISVFPNPFDDVTLFEIKSNKTEIYSFELTDVLAKKVKSKTGISEKQFEISREGLQNGIYFYKVYSSESVIGIGKVVIK
jgi:PKD repeat protein